MNTQTNAASAVAALSLSLLLVLVSGAAHADPPYGDSFDAPDTFETAVQISPAAGYRGLYELFAYDVDYYKFTVSQGQDISIVCTQLPTPHLTQAVKYPCTARLFNPAGAEQSSGISSDGFSTQLSFKGAGAGDWRLAISGVDVGTVVTFCCQETAYVFSIALTTAGAADASDKPIQPGAPKYVHGGPTQGTPFGVCTMNFVFADKKNTYIGSAGHCTRVVGERETAPDIGEFGTVAFRVSCKVQVLPDSCPNGGPETDDFALIRVDADKLGMVSPVMRGVGAAPTGFTTSDGTAQGDLLTMHGQGAPFGAEGTPFGAVPATRTQTGVLESDDANSYSSTLVGATQSGSPIWHVSDGKALGIATTGAPLTAGPTVERIMVLLSEAGFNVTLVTRDSKPAGKAEPIAVTDDVSGKQGSGLVLGALSPALLLGLMFAGLRRRMR